MKFSRATVFPLLLAFALLFAQQAGAAHTMRHALEEQTQHDKAAPHSATCEQCETYAQLGSALNVGALDFIPLPVSDEAAEYRIISFRSAHTFPAVARGPPAPLQTFI